MLINVFYCAIARRKRRQLPSVLCKLYAHAFPYSGIRLLCLSPPLLNDNSARLRRPLKQIVFVPDIQQPALYPSLLQAPFVPVIYQLFCRTFPFSHFTSLALLLYHQYYNCFLQHLLFSLVSCLPRAGRACSRNQASQAGFSSRFQNLLPQTPGRKFSETPSLQRRLHFQQTQRPQFFSPVSCLMRRYCTRAFLLFFLSHLPSQGRLSNPPQSCTISRSCRRHLKEH